MESQRREQEMLRRREEQRRLAQRRQERSRAGKKKNKGHLLVFMLCLLVVGCVVSASFTVLFPIKTVQIEGESRYTDEQLIAAASIPEGYNLLRLRPQTVENNIRRICPYITQVTLKRKLPSRVIVQVLEQAPALAFSSGANFILTTSTYEYIETVESQQSGIAVYGPVVLASEPGQPVVFEDPAMEELLNQLIYELTQQSISQISKIDLTDPQHIRLQYKDLHIWKLGDITNLSYKLQFGKAVSEKETGTGTLDLSSLDGGTKNSYFKSEALGEFIDVVTQTDVSVVTATDVR